MKASHVDFTWNERCISVDHANHRDMASPIFMTYVNGNESKNSNCSIWECHSMDWFYGNDSPAPAHLVILDSLFRWIDGFSDMGWASTDLPSEEMSSSALMKFERIKHSFSSACCWQVREAQFSRRAFHPFWSCKGSELTLMSFFHDRKAK